MAASNSQRVALQSLLKQGVLVTASGQTQITLAPHAVYGLEPERTKVPARGDISPIPRPPEEHPIPPAVLNNSGHEAEQTATPALNNS